MTALDDHSPARRYVRIGSCWIVYALLGTPAGAWEQADTEAWSVFREALDPSADVIADIFLLVVCVTALVWFTIRSRFRRGPRHLCRVPATLGKQCNEMSCTIFDISRRGALLSLPPGHGIDRGHRFRVKWCGDWVDVEARWSEPHLVGVKFTSPVSTDRVTQALAINEALGGPEGERKGEPGDRRKHDPELKPSPAATRLP